FMGLVNIRYIRTLATHQAEDNCVVLNEEVTNYRGLKSVNEVYNTCETILKWSVPS
ncbi:12482_t:CDS:1, partial [Racocetra persica]